MANAINHNEQTIGWKRQLESIIKGQKTSDGAGVSLTRMIGSQVLNTLDPFLLFDVFESDQAEDYIGGFPPHPHRGFETVTYLLNGRLRHKDNGGHEGVIESGGVQWMTAGRGIIHSEMPEQEQGLLKGFQLWLNLPAREKMRQPAYQEFSADEIAHEKQNDGTEVRVIAGTTNTGTTGPVQNEYVHPLYMDISLPADEIFNQQTAVEDNAFIYIIEGQLEITTNETSLEQNVLSERELGILTPGDSISVKALNDTRFLLLSARPLNEPIVRGGPFVMNSKEEILQAFEDFQNNNFQE